MKTAQLIKFKATNISAGLNFNFEVNKPEKNAVVSCLEKTYKKFHSIPPKSFRRHVLTNILSAEMGTTTHLMLNNDDVEAFSSDIDIEAIEAAITAYNEHEGLEEEARLEAAGVTAEELEILDIIAQLHEAFEMAAHARCVLFIDLEEPEKADSPYDDFDAVLNHPEKFTTTEIVASFLQAYIYKNVVICDPRKFKFNLQAHLNTKTKTIVMNIAKITGNNPVEFTYTFGFTNLGEGEFMMGKIQGLFEHIRETQPAVYFE